MSDRRLEELMSRPAPDEREASARSYEVARAAFEQRPPAPARPRLGAVPAMVTVALIAVAVALALTPAGGAVADLIREGLGESVEGERPAEPALTALPSGGELLVVSRQGPWVVHSDGSQRLLGRFDDASWSPSGVHVVVSRGRQLSALTPTGEPRWSLARRSPVSGARWSPDPGWRVAYLSGDSLRVVGGDSAYDRLEARNVASTPPAWRPIALEVGEEAQPLAYADRGGRVEVIDLDRGRSFWRSGPGERPIQLEWSSDGERLAAVGRRTLRVFDDRGRLLDERALPAGLPAPAARGERPAAFRPGTHELALIRASRTASQSEVVLFDAQLGRPRTLYAGPGSFSELAWSPDGRSLLVGWPSADQFLFLRPDLRPDHPRRVTAVSNVAPQFSPGAGRAAEFPRIAGWCCPP